MDDLRRADHDSAAEADADADVSSVDPAILAGIVAKGPQPVLRYLFFLIVVRPVMLVIMGMNVRGQERLAERGPMLVVANHNSHLDTFALMTLFPMNELHRVRPVAAADYFLRTRWFAWFSIRVLGIIPIDRDVRRGRGHPLDPISEQLNQGAIVLLFPEGTRGEPEQREPFQRGIAHLARRHPDVPIVPVFMYGLGKALPRGEGLLVPFFIDAYVGERLQWTGNKDTMMERLDTEFQRLADGARVPETF
ncbi:lysophospholipid acyltransferase family protein [Allorhodopirellula heiligendammensis]|uniref:2-acyl-glycerophospho-ethanolamine acyltransferase n=1 Tax=Allorhodopirellula heiligendammensis TaxID=2714739 RepID=A0A5C6B9G4_9BACT|nr:lysophospholipid acyltransferase family protein [Allorhodopirellula heiligendammensis]TWU08598.1 2-acyl-glycerophospho-ethanolamine acyltransferase [Allorhodopirellula heiligendammensis]